MEIAVIAGACETPLLDALDRSPIDAATVRRCADPADVVAARLVMLAEPDDLASVRALRAASIDVAILAVVGSDAGASGRAFDAGADDAIEASDLTPRLLARAIRDALSHREALLSELRLVDTTRKLAESLVLEEDLETIADVLLHTVREHVCAELGFLVFEWSWYNVADRLLAVSGAVDGDGDKAALIGDPGLAALFSEAGISAVDIGPDSPFGSIASALCVPIAEGSSWGRGGIVLASPRSRAFAEHDLTTAHALASLAGVAILNASIRRERNRAIEVRESVLAVASHDLRTPLSVFSMAVELLVETDNPDERARLAGRARRSIANMRRLIGNILDYAAVDAGRLRIEREHVKAGSIARRIVAAVAGDAEKAELELELEVENEPVILADSGRIEQALTNIVNNAIKFTPAGGRIDISVATRGSHVVFAITDTGPGISDDMQRRLFDRDYTSAGSSGVGLGLSIARGIVAAHGGDLSLESTLGEGSTFSLTLPAGGDPEGP